MSLRRRDFMGACAAASAALLAGCATQASTQSAPTTAAPPRRSDGGPVIDVHAHWYPRAFADLIEKEGAANGAPLGKSSRGYLTFLGPGLTSEFSPERVELSSQLKHMDATGVDIHALSLTSPMTYWAPPAFGLRLSQAFNDAAIRAHQDYPKRFVGLATVPMHAPDLAVKELERVGRDPAIRGVYMSTHVNGRNLDEKQFFPVYAKCEELGLHVYLHPTNTLAFDRMQRYYLRNFLGNPYETGVAAASLMFGGVMDMFPKLYVVLPHAGGTFPVLIGRMDHGATVRPETKHMKRPPSEYLRRFYYDTISHHVPLMEYLVKLVGADRVVLGSDHPADMSIAKPPAFVGSLPNVSQRDKDLILGGNAQRLLRL